MAKKDFNSEARKVLTEAVQAWADQFDGVDETDLEVSGADLVDWFADWRDRAKAALAIKD
jgi:histidinol dehydrogenase